MNEQNPELHGALAPPAPPVTYQPHFGLPQIPPPPAHCPYHYGWQFPISHGGQFMYLAAGIGPYIAAFIGPDGVPLPLPPPPMGPPTTPGSQAEAPSKPGSPSSSPPPLSPFPPPPPPPPPRSPPSPTPSPYPSPPPPPQLRYRKRPRILTLKMKYMPALDFLDRHPPLEPFRFWVGSSLGNIPYIGHVKATDSRSTMMDGYMEHFTKLHKSGKSFGGNFDPSDLLVAAEDPLHVAINRVATLKATKQNIKKDLLRLVNCIVRRRYVQDGRWPAYAEDFIARIEALKTGPNLTRKEEKRWHVDIWVIRNHPFLVGASKRRILLEDYYKLYRTLSRKAASALIARIDSQIYRRWQVLIPSRDKLLAFAYWHENPRKRPADYFTKNHAESVDPREENPRYFFYTSEGGYLGVFLRHFIVHGPELAKAYHISLEELDLIVAYYFGNFLPSFLGEMYEACETHIMPKEILEVYKLRRSVSRGPLGSNKERDDVERRSKRSRSEEGRGRDRERHGDCYWYRSSWEHRERDRDGNEKEQDGRSLNCEREMEEREREKEKDGQWRSQSRSKRCCDDKDGQWRSKSRSKRRRDDEGRDGYYEYVRVTEGSHEGPGDSRC